MIDIIIPVYDGLEETKRCLQSVIRFSNINPEANILVINDCSPNPLIRDYLQALASTGVIQLLTNKHNLGFVATVNRGMATHVDRDVLLLNSDTEVSGNWLERILEHAKKDKKIATITPFSNNAEICSFPKYCQSNELPAGYTVAEIDALFANLKGELIDVPTGVGFCMYISRAALNDVGYFDEKTFGRGYGEENDFCQRAAKRGWRNATCSNVFVYHEGGVSFSAEKVERVNNAMHLLDQKHPNYHADVHAHLAIDPERKIRNIIQLQLLQQNPLPKVLAIGHGLGGGVVKHIHELGDAVSGQCIQLFLRPVDEDLFELSCQINELDMVFYFERNDLSDLALFLNSLSVSRLHWHHTMGYRFSEIEYLMSLGIPMWATIHDYYWIGGNPTLTDDKGVFAQDIESRDALCQQAYPLPSDVKLSEWREFFAAFLMRCEKCIAPSAIAAIQMHAYYPSVNIDVVQHVDWEMYSPYRPPFVPKLASTDKLKVLVIGAMSREKGADVLERTATYQDPLYRLEYHLLGYAYKPLAEEVICHGPYRDEDLINKIQDIGPHIIWFPAQWHETYCYVLTAVLRLGYPIICTDLGAFHERLSNRAFSFILPWQTSPIEWNDTLLQIRDLMLTQQNADEALLAWPQSSLTDFRYLNDYAVGLVNSVGDVIPPNLIIKWTQAKSLKRSTRQKERFLKVLWYCRQLPLLRNVARLVPFEKQRAVKRWLSRKPMHEVV